MSITRLKKDIPPQVLGVKQNTSHVRFKLMTLYGVIIQASEV